MQEIRNAVAAYALAASTLDEQRWVGQFAEDGVLAVQGEEHAGRAAITRYFRDMLAPGEVTHQQVHNLHVEVDGDTARGQSLWTVLRHQPDGTAVSLAGYYNDEYVRTAAGWKIERRVISHIR